MNLDLQKIPVQYRPAPFWSWNDRLESDELRRQIREMHDAGLGGFFMHARGGLQTPYLSDEWMECVKVCIAEAEKYGMQAWLYDENGWPSGFGDGKVNGAGVKYQEKYLRYEYIDAERAGDVSHTIGFYHAGTLAFLGRELPHGAKGRFLRCFFEINPYYVDNLDAEVVAEFLRVTHQRYFEALPPELRDKLSGVFTDEPQLSRNGLPWSFILEKEYRAAYGRELAGELPSLFLETSESPAMRIRFWSLCARLFSRNYMGQIREWCDLHHWKLIGHHVLEETFRRQINPNGAIMPQYRHYHIPGVDHLGRFEPSPMAAVQLVSSAAQFGQKQRMSESFAGTGWACHFTDMRWIYLPQMAHGINFLCPHLAAYSLRGLRKRDFPGSSFYHQPWWRDYRKFTDTISRIGMILAEGKEETDVLVVHPISSVWKLFTGEEQGKLLDGYNDALEKITRALDALQISHHYADEAAVDAAGSVRSGGFQIGEMVYHTVVVPQLSNLSAKVAALLRQFAAEGGKIFVVENRLEKSALTIDGVAASAEYRRWFRSLPAFPSEKAAAYAVAKGMEKIAKVEKDGIAAEEILSTSREVTIDGRSGKFYYFVNRDRDRAVRVRIELPASGGEVEILDELSGKFFRLAGVENRENRFRFAYTFAAASDAGFFVTSRSQFPLRNAGEIPENRPLLTLPDDFSVKRHSGNIVTLDRCFCRLADGTGKQSHVVDLQTDLLNRQYRGPLELEFEFFCDEDFDFRNPPMLAVETPGLFRFSLNGVPFEARETGYLFDRAFHLIPLPASCRPGRNLLVLSLVYVQPESVCRAIEAARKFESENNKLRFETELESVYLYGDFSVRHHGIPEPLAKNAVRYNGTFSLGASLIGKSVKASDLLASGFPFFCGDLILEKKFTLTAEELRKCKDFRMKLHGANSCRLKVNGRDAGGCFWEPFQWEIFPYLTAGENSIEVELTTSLRNMLGPHHLADGESYGVSPLAFLQEPSVIGRLPPPGDPGYCFVNFGMENLELGKNS